LNVERVIRVIAGTFVLASVGLGYWVSPYWFLFTALVGLNLVQSGFTNWCLMETILVRAGLPRAGDAPRTARFTVKRKPKRAAPRPKAGKRAS